MAVIERGKFHKTESLPDGRRQTTIGIAPLHYRDDQGAWQDIDTSWANVGGARPNAITAASLMVSMADDGLRRIHPTRDVNKWVEIGAPYIKPAATWQKVALGTPARSGNTLTWTTANANGYCWHGGHFVKMGFLLKDPDNDGVVWTPPNNQFAFPVGISGLTRSGSTILDNGVPVMFIDKPVVYDLDNPLDRRDITFSFTNITIGGQPQAVLLMTLPDLTGMSRPLVDPTLTLQPDATDGIDALLINDSQANSNLGTFTLLSAGKENGGTFVARSLIKFDLTSLPSAALITSATLSLYATINSSINARTYRLYRVKRSWLEDQATWNAYSAGNLWQTAGADGANDRESTDIGSRTFSSSETLNAFKDFSLTPTTKADLDLGNGWILKADTEISDEYYFSSSDAVVAGNRPKLVIVYTVAQSNSGVLTSAGALSKQVVKNLAGVIASSGALAKQAQKPLAGVMTSAGTLSKRVSKSFAGVMTSAGSLVAQAQKNVSGVITSTGSLSSLPMKELSGAIFFGGSLVAHGPQHNDGDLISAGDLNRSTAKSFGGGLTSAGELLRQPSKLLSGNLSFSGFLATLLGRFPSGVLTSSGTVSKAVQRSCAGTLSMSGSLTISILSNSPTLTLTDFPYVELTLTDYNEEGVTMEGEINSYDVGDRPTIRGVFELANSRVDPLIVRVQVKKPDGTLLAKAYPTDSSDLQRDSSGVYFWRLPTLETGDKGYWTYRMASELTFETAEWSQFYVRPDPITG